MIRPEENSNVLDEPTASQGAGGSGIERAVLEKATQLGVEIEARMDPCLQLMGLTWDEVLPPGMTVGELRVQVTQAIGPLLIHEQENLPTYLMQVFRRLRIEKVAAKNVQPSIVRTIGAMTASIVSRLRSAITPVARAG